MAKKVKKKAARSGRKSSKAAKRATRAPRKARKTTKRAPKKAKKAKKPQKRTRPARKAPKRAKLSKKKARRPARSKAPAMKPRGKKAPGRKPVAPKVRGKSPIRKKAAGTPARKALPRNAATAKANAEAAKKVPALNRERRRLAETDEELMPSTPSSLGYAGGSSAARSGRSELREALAEHTETSPELTGGDVDANWEDAYAVGDEAPGGDNPTPDQDRVDDIGKALGVQYNDNEELKGSEKIIERDRHRWELDPASSDDYRDRSRDDD